MDTIRLDQTLFDDPRSLYVHVLGTNEYTILFGAGPESTSDQIVDIVREYKPDVVVVEHGDGDYYGGVPAIREQTDRPSEVAVPDGDADWLREDGIEPDHELGANEEHWGFEMIAIPGHTPSNLSYRYEDVLVAGDTVLGSDFNPVAADWWSGKLAISEPSTNKGGDNLAQESIRKQAQYDFDIVLLTHGSSVFDNGHEERENLIGDSDRNISRIDVPT